jgi:hypothetical protein
MSLRVNKVLIHIVFHPHGIIPCFGYAAAACVGRDSFKAVLGGGTVSAGLAANPSSDSMHVIAQWIPIARYNRGCYVKFCSIAVAVVICSAVFHLNTTFSTSATTSFASPQKASAYLPYIHQQPRLYSEDVASSFSPSAYVFASSPKDPTTIFVVVSAFVDTRMLMYNATPLLVIIGTSSFAAWGGKVEMYALIRTGESSPRRTKCAMQQHPEERARSQTIRTTALRCVLHEHWSVLQKARDLYACVYSRSPDECNDIPFVPVSLMPNFPLAPSIPQDKTLSAGANDQSVAICLQPLTGDVYDVIVRFFLWYYKQLGVSTVIAYDVHASETFHKRAAEASDDFGIKWENHPWCPLTRSSSPACPERLRILNKESWQWHANGQIAAQMDCVLRAAGRFRWVLFVDLDEYITLTSDPHLTLSQFVAMQAANSSSWFTRQSVMPYAAVFNNQHFRMCESTSLPVPVPYLRESILPQAKLDSLPYPVTFQTALGSATPGRGKFMCDPLLIDELMVHKPLSSLCKRYHTTSMTTLSGIFSCPPILHVAPSKARSIHVRSPNSTRGNWTKCGKDASIDYSLANRVVPLLSDVVFG